MGKHAPSEEKKRIKEKRGALETKIETFQQQGIGFIPQSPEILATITTRLEASRAPETQSGSEGSDEEEFFNDDDQGWEEDEDAQVPIEEVRLGLPSSFSKAERDWIGLGQLERIEIELWEGQANDALEALRAGLAEKSLRFWTEVKPAKSQRTMTRAWDSIHRADNQIKAAVGSYRLAKGALESLGASKQLLDQYQDIRKEDLKMSRDIVEENRVGQRSSELAWIWRLDWKWESNQGEFMKECEYQFCL